MNVLILINDFINDIYNITTFEEKLKEINDFSTISNEVDFTDIDKAIHAYLIILFNHFEKLDLSLDSTNPCYLYLQELVENIESSKFVFHVKEDTLLIVSIDNIYIIMNHSQKIVTVDLPVDLQNKEVYCLNCNDDMKLKNTIKLPDYSFYAFSLD